MAISNYNELKAAVKNWLNDDNLDTYIPDFITLAEARLYRELRLSTMVTSLSSTISSGVISVPTDFIEFIDVAISGSPNRYLEVRPSEWILSNYPTRSADSKPIYIGRQGSSFIFGPYPDTTYTVVGNYYKRLSALSSTTTNWFTSYAPDILLFSSLLEAEPFIHNDERLVMWEAKYQNAKKSLEKEERRGFISGPKRSVAN